MNVGKQKEIEVDLDQEKIKQLKIRKIGRNIGNDRNENLKFINF
jgi:sporulation protein YlmC with PRC-barrel domain